MDKSTITLLLGLTLGLSVVTLLVVLSRGSSSLTLAMPQPLQYNNNEKWEIKKDANGRVQTVVVHREATET